MNNLEPVIVTFIVFYFIYQIIALFARRKERMALIEKLSTCDPVANSSFMEQYMERLPRGGGSSLRIACLLLGVGLGFMVGVLLTPQFEMALSRFNDNLNLYDTVEMCWLATSFMFGGLGLLISSIIESRSCKK